VFGDGHIGGQFTGKGAQLALVPGSGIGKPTTGHHVAG
jgi:ABC-type dipeptide/oligopeptide/nickel transport system ATPase subunit